MSFNVKYRPSSFSDMVGQRLNAVVLDQMVKTNSVPSALLFSGPRGTGKTTAARILAGALNPDEREEILAGRSLSVIEIDAASNGSVADVRSLVEQLQYGVGADSRVIILDEAHSITREGFNALLKTLEEPPPAVVFVLVTTEPHKLPDTILSRLTEFEFRRVSSADILVRLVHICTAEELTVLPELLQRIADSADGSVRDAVKTLDFTIRAGVNTVEEFDELFGSKDAAPYLLAAVLTGDAAKIYSSLDRLMADVGDARVLSSGLADLFADLFVLQAGGDIKAAGAALDLRVRLAKAVNADSLYAAASVLWDLRTKIRPSEDALSSLRLALMLIAKRLGQETAVSVNRVVETKSQVESKVEERPLSLSELQQT